MTFSWFRLEIKLVDYLNKVALGSREKALFKNLLIGFNNCGRKTKRRRMVQEGGGKEEGGRTLWRRITNRQKPKSY